MSTFVFKCWTTLVEVPEGKGVFPSPISRPKSWLNNAHRPRGSCLPQILILFQFSTILLLFADNPSPRAWPKSISQLKQATHILYPFRTKKPRQNNVDLTLSTYQRIFNQIYQRYKDRRLRSLNLPLTFCPAFVCPYDTYYHGIQRQSTPLGSKSSWAKSMRKESSRNSWPFLPVDLYQLKDSQLLSVSSFAGLWKQTQTCSYIAAMVYHPT